MGNMFLKYMWLCLRFYIKQEKNLRSMLEERRKVVKESMCDAGQVWAKVQKVKHKQALQC